MSVSVLNPCCSAKRVSIWCRSPAKSAASSPPVPARSSTITSLSSAGIALDHGEPQLLLDPGKRGSGLRELLLRERAHLGVAVGRELGRLVLLGRELAPPARQVRRAREPLVLARHLGVAALVREHGRVAQLGLELGIAALDLCHQRFHPANSRVRPSWRMTLTESE